MTQNNSEKGKREFPLFQSHLDFAQTEWKKVAKKGFWAIDATCGNGFDTVLLSKLFDGVIAIDIQPKAIENCQLLLQEKDPVYFFCQSHASFPQIAFEKPILLIVYNLGYLPGGNKEKTTQAVSTLESIKQALSLLQPGGLISITCYPGHSEGHLEESLLFHFFSTLDSWMWSASHHSWRNRRKSPSVFLIQKNR